MITLLSVAAPLRVLPKQSARFVSKGKRIISYQPKRLLDNQRQLIEWLQYAQRKPPAQGPLRLQIQFRFQRPKSKKNWQVWKISRPDLDNLCKQVSDALQKAGAFKDDAQIVSIAAEKAYADKDAVFIRLSEVEETDLPEIA